MPTPTALLLGYDAEAEIERKQLDEGRYVTRDERVFIYARHIDAARVLAKPLPLATNRTVVELEQDVACVVAYSAERASDGSINDLSRDRVTPLDSFDEDLAVSAIESQHRKDKRDTYAAADARMTAIEIARVA